MLQLIQLLLAIVSEVTTTVPACTECPAKGVWSQWKDYTSCSATCGLFGTKVQTRTCNSWEEGCPCVGVTSRALPCAPAVCPTGAVCKAGYTKYLDSATNKNLCGNVSRTDNYVAPTCAVNKIYDNCPCPPGGLWSAWTSSGKCNATCGLCGTVTQTRTCRSTSWCPCSGASTRVQACPKTPCTTGPACCKTYPVVRNLVTDTSQCGLQLAADPILPLPTCPKTTTTKATTTVPPCTCSGNPSFSDYPPASPPTPPPPGIPGVCETSNHQWGCNADGYATVLIELLLVDYSGNVALNRTFCGTDWAANIINAPCDTGFPPGSSVNYASWEGAQINYFVCKYHYESLQCGATTTSTTPTTTPTTTASTPACQSCAQNLASLETTDGTMEFSYSVDQTSQCLVANWSCSNIDTNMYFYVDDFENIEVGCDAIVPSGAGTTNWFKCQSDGTWTLGTATNIQKISCMTLGSC